MFGQARPPAAVVELGANLPVRPVAAGDLLAITIYGAPEMSRSVRVSEGGFIRLPLLKRKIEARGAVPSELELRVGSAITEERILVDPAVVVTIAEYAVRRIRVAGAVRHPLTFEATGPVTLLEALTRAEGLSAEAGAEILVTRTSGLNTGGLTKRIVVKDLIETADPAANLILEGGEDVRDEDLMEEYREYLDQELRHLDYAPIAFVTAKDGKNVQVVIDLAQHLYKQANERVSTANTGSSPGAVSRVMAVTASS